MNPVSAIGKLAGSGVAATAKGVASIFTENREERGKRSHDANMAVLDQFAAEFTERSNRTWFDSLADGLNRLVRPLFALLFFLSLVAVPAWPEHALLVATSLSAMPEGFWILGGMIVTFYFGGRMQLKSQDFKLKTNVIHAARNIAEVKRAILPEEEPHRDEAAYDAMMADETTPLPNWAIDEWNKRNNAS